VVDSLFRPAYTAWLGGYWKVFLKRLPSGGLGFQPKNRQTCLSGRRFRQSFILQ